MAHYATTIKKNGKWRQHRACCHTTIMQNAAPFAVLRAFAKMYPALSLRNLAWLAHSLGNGTHRPARTFGVAKDLQGQHCPKAGIALTAHPTLKRAVNEVCSVRRKKIGSVTAIIRQGQHEDKIEQIETRKQKGSRAY